MKKLLFLLLTGTLLLATSCKDDEEMNAIFTDDAAELIAASIGSNSGGAAQYIGVSANISATSNELKSASLVVVLADSTYSDSGTITSAASGNIGTWSYGWDYLLTYDAAAQHVNSSFTYSGEVDLPRFSSAPHGSGNFVYANLIQAGTASTLNTVWLMNGDFTRTAIHNSKVTSKQITSTSVVEFQDCEVTTDGTRRIVSGLAYITITGTVPNQGSFEYTATVTFGSGSYGTLNIDGKTYTISIEEGQVQ